MNDVLNLSPLQQLWRMQNEVDRLFNGLLPQQTETNKTDTAVWSPRADLAENDDAYLITLDLPGMSKSEVNIDYHEGTLRVSGERSISKREGARTVHFERWGGHFYREFNLPKSINANKIEAAYHDGVLAIQVPKAEVSKPRRIKVK